MVQANWLFRNTAASKGRTITITPETSAFKAIHAGRIVLDRATPKASGKNEGRETTLLCLHGSGRVKVGSEEFELNKFDGIYIGRGEAFEVSTDNIIDIVEASAPTLKSHPTHYVDFESEVKNSDSLTLHVGVEPYYRDIHKVLAENVEGSRLLMGVTMSKPGNWTSWPPHEHAATREELYLFFDMPRPGFGTQFIYSNLENPEFVQPVYENDAVTIVEGYHPNVAAPGYPINFCWVLCSLEDDSWRTL
ncbi:MAG TPA: 5-deoxy-glucuronate isomerase, partial [Candidatus Kapabacteria bacterium]|nr:5-deoxy-glucuronate isomerase [Candidatus Kapabacteria bacterium]